MSKNVNCLEGMRCPQCEHDDEVVVHARMWVALTDDGTDPYADSTDMGTGTEYGDRSAARCPECGHEGRLGEWYIDRVAGDFMEAGLALEIVHSAAVQLRDRHGEIASPASTPHEFDTALDVVEDLIVNNFG